MTTQILAGNFALRVVPLNLIFDARHTGDGGSDDPHLRA